MNDSLKFSLAVSADLNKVLDDMAEKTHYTKSEILLRSIILMDVAVQEKEKGNHLGVINKEQKILKEIVGL